MRRYALSAGILVLIYASVMAFCLLTMPELPNLRSGELYPDSPQSCYGLQFDQTDREPDKLRFELHAKDASALKSLSIVLADIRSFQMTVNGRLCYQYEGTPAAHRVHEIRLSQTGIEGNTAEIVVTCPSLTYAVKGLIGSAEYIDRRMKSAFAFNMLILGMYAAIILNCLILYSKKHSESYLLYMCFFTLACVCTGLLYVNYAIRRTLLGDILHMGYLHALSQGLGLILCINILRIPLRGKAKRTFPLFLLAAELGGVFVCNACFSLKERSLFNDLLVLPTLSAVIWACGNQRSHSLKMLIGTGISGGLSTYYSLANQRIVPLSEMLYYIHMPAVYYMVFVMCCMLTVDSIFSEKFHESEMLALQIEKANHELDEKVRQRTSALESVNVKLREEQRERHSMMTNLFHDIRSPLFSAMGYAQMLQGKNEKEAKYLKSLRSQLEYLSHLTESLFLVAKLEEQAITFVYSRVSLNRLCETIIEELQVHANEQHDTIHFDAQAEICVMGDGFRLRQALENIVLNAIVHTPEKTEIAIRLEQNAHEAILSVADNGCGIPSEEVPYIFERYYSERRKQKKRSSGLGLTIANQIVKAHNGKIIVQSELHHGTTFTVMLPLWHMQEE